MADRPEEDRILVCGGCGFIGSNFVHLLSATASEKHITVADALTYAGSTDNLEPLLSEERITFVQVDISDPRELSKLQQFKFSMVLNFAAETHVDRSLYHADQFVRTNVLGTQNLLGFCHETNARMLQISTDEVYGPADATGRFDERASLNPTSPYAASKAAADLLVQAAIKTRSQDAAIVRTCNNYGPRQYPEKLIPYFLSLIEEEMPLPVYGDGLQKRSWIHVGDFCRALLAVIEDIPTGEVINIGTDLDCTNLELVKMLLASTGGNSKVKHVTDRPAHDRRYALDSSKFEARYGKMICRPLKEGIEQTVNWYKANSSIFARLQDRDAAEFRKRHYGS